MELPNAEPGFPFGPDWEVVKVCGKVFLLLTAVPGTPVATLKSDPVEARALRHDFPDEITAGYHMNKRHWITLAEGPLLDEEQVAELVTESYRLVVAGMPKRLQPVDPEAFGRDPR